MLLPASIAASMLLPGRTSLPFMCWDVINLLEEGVIQSIEFYDSCRTMVASTADNLQDLTVTIPPASLSLVLKKAREHSVRTTSHFSKKFSHAGQPVPIHTQAMEKGLEQTLDYARSGLASSGEADEQEPVSSRAQLEAVVEVTDDDIPLYYAEQMHTVIEEMVDLAISQLSESPSCPLADAVPGIVAKLKSTYVLDDGNQYSKFQVRELIGTIGRICGDEENLFGR